MEIGLFVSCHVSWSLSGSLSSLKKNSSMCMYVHTKVKSDLKKRTCITSQCSTEVQWVNSTGFGSCQVQVCHQDVLDIKWTGLDNKDSMTVFDQKFAIHFGNQCKFDIFFENQSELVIVSKIMSSFSYLQKSVPAWQKYGKLVVISNFMISLGLTYNLSLYLFQVIF